MRLIATAALVAVASQVASAQFVTSITKPAFGSNDPDVFFTDFNAGTSTFLLNPELDPNVSSSAPGFTGLAADEANRRLFAGTTAGTTTGIYTIDYDTLTPTFLTTTRNAAGGNGPVLDGLAFDTNTGTLFGTRVLGGSTGAEGLYTIDLATGLTTLVFEYETTATSNFQIGGMDFDPVTGLLYLSDDDDTGGRWIYSIDPANPASGLTQVVQYPAGVTDVDGLGAGDGKLYLLSDGINGNGGQHVVIDIATGLVIDSIATPYPAYSNSVLGLINPSGGGAFAPGIPAPASAALLGLAGLAAARRRR